MFKINALYFLSLQAYEKQQLARDVFHAFRNMAQALRFARYKTGPQPYAACRVTNALLGFQTLFIQ